MIESCFAWKNKDERAHIDALASNRSKHTSIKNKSLDECIALVKAWLRTSSERRWTENIDLLMLQGYARNILINLEARARAKAGGNS